MASSRRQYPFHLIEPKWQQTWAGQAAFRAFNPGETVPAGHPFAQRFAYVVARMGVTGDGQATDLGPVRARLQALRTVSDRPLAVGFGLDHPDLLERVRAMGATPVVGAALVQALHGGQTPRGFLATRMGGPT